MTQLDIEITPAHQELAARLGLAAVDGDAARIDATLDEVRAAGMESALAVIAVLARNLAAGVLVSHGLEGARAVFQRTILDAGVADDD